MDFVHIRKEELEAMVKAINAILEDDWTSYETKVGKEFDLVPAWRRGVSIILGRYRKAGWLVSRRIEICSSSPGAPRDYLIFKNPSWLKCPEQIRTTGVR